MSGRGLRGEERRTFTLSTRRYTRHAGRTQITRMKPTGPRPHPMDVAALPRPLEKVPLQLQRVEHSLHSARAGRSRVRVGHLREYSPGAASRWETTVRRGPHPPLDGHAGLREILGEELPHLHQGNRRRSHRKTQRFSSEPGSGTPVRGPRARLAAASSARTTNLRIPRPSTTMAWCVRSAADPWRMRRRPRPS